MHDPTIIDGDGELTPVLQERAGRVLTIAIVGGIAAEYLIHGMVFHGSPAGVGLSLMLAVPILLLLAGGWVIGEPPGRSAVILLMAGLFFAAMVSVRSSSTLTSLNVLAVVALVPLAAYSYRPGRVSSLGVFGFVRVVLGGMATSLGQPILFVQHDTGDWLQRVRTGTARSRPILRGLLPALILLLVFGTLLASADAVFANALNRIVGFDIDAGPLIGAGFLALLAAWLMIGIARHAADSRQVEETSRGIGYLGAVETITMLAPLVVLFLAFVLIQFAYLFGGVDTIEATGGLTRAEYYRQGFFQLVAVAALVTVLILTVDWMHRPADQPPKRTVAALSASLVVLTLVMVGSALVRLKLYVDSFGLTELRVYTTAFTIWVAIALALLLGTVLRGKRKQFALGTLIAGIVVGVALNTVNPDALISHTNLDRHVDGFHDLDASYLTSYLSADAVPVIADRLDEIDDPCLRSDLAAGLGNQVSEGGGWRSFHWGRSRALHSLDGLPVLYEDCDG